MGYYSGLLVLLCVAVASAIAPLHKAEKEAIAGSYIVMFKDDIADDQLVADLTAFSANHNITYYYTYSVVSKGFAAKLTPEQLFRVRTHPRVDFVEEDAVVHMSQSCPYATGDWGLNRICQRASNLDGYYYYPSSQGQGVDAYIIDTGIYLGHNDFGGRATFGYKANNSWSNNDDQGHGTHVASTVAGSVYGVAKQASLIAVRVLGPTGSGSVAGVINGVNWAAQSQRTRGRPSVGNMSLGGSRSTALNNAVNAASAGGLHMVVAAGNENSDACNGSPSSASGVITVGATDQYDSRSSFSNYGTCVHVLAPGSGILGAWIGSPSASNRISGTSMASPHVCGVAALLAGQNPSWTFTQMRSYIQDSASSGYISLNCGNTACSNTPNLLVYNDC
jgi:subtilisin family serine protease